MSNKPKIVETIPENHYLYKWFCEWEVDRFNGNTVPPFLLREESLSFNWCKYGTKKFIIKKRPTPCPNHDKEGPHECSYEEENYQFNIAQAEGKEHLKIEYLRIKFPNLSDEQKHAFFNFKQGYRKCFLWPDSEIRIDKDPKLTIMEKRQLKEDLTRARKFTVGKISTNDLTIQNIKYQHAPGATYAHTIIPRANEEGISKTLSSFIKILV